MRAIGSSFPDQPGFLLVDSPDEADALAGKGLDQALILAVVADCIAGGVDTGCKRGLRDNPSSPDCGDQIVPAYNMVPVADQVGQDIEDLRLDRDERGSSAQLAPIRIKTVVSKSITQRPAS